MGPLSGGDVLLHHLHLDKYESLAQAWQILLSRRCWRWNLLWPQLPKRKPKQRERLQALERGRQCKMEIHQGSKTGQLSAWCCRHLQASKFNVFGRPFLLIFDAGKGRGTRTPNVMFKGLQLFALADRSSKIQPATEGVEPLIIQQSHE